MEKFFYDYRPHLCFAFAVYAHKFAPRSKFEIFCALSLAACGTYLLFMRNRSKVMNFLKFRR